jgi:amidohydrolase
MPGPAALRTAADHFLQEVVELRRSIHSQPELGGCEVVTAAQVADRLARSGIEVRTGVGGHGVVATVGCGSPCIALRADMDALPIQEATGLPWESRNPGVMHACGHDFHTAWLVGAGLVLQEVGLPRGIVKLIFQPSEETLGGALGMIASGVLTDPDVHAICGAHVWPEYPAGVIGLREGPNLAAADRFRVVISGSGTHGAMPHLGRDPVIPAAEMVLALQTLVSRRLDPQVPGVLSVCQMHAGTAFNVIPGVAELGGTVRSVREEDRQALQHGIEDCCGAIAIAHGCTAEVEYERGVPPTTGDARMTRLARDCVAGVSQGEIEVIEARASMGAEDFAFYLEHCPGALLWIGCGGTHGNPQASPLHDAHFVAAEECLHPAMLSMAAIALGYLEREGS